jgi:hypothetical protein
MRTYQELNKAATQAQNKANKAAAKKETLKATNGKSDKVTNTAVKVAKDEAKVISQDLREIEKSIQKKLVDNSKFLTLQYKKLLQTGCEVDASTEEKLFVNKYLKNVKFVDNVIDVMGLLTYSQAVKFYANGCKFTENEVIALCKKWYSLTNIERENVAVKATNIFAQYKAVKANGFTFETFDKVRKMFDTKQHKANRYEAQVLILVRPFDFVSNPELQAIFKAKEGEELHSALNKFIQNSTGLQHIEDLTAITKGRELLTLNECKAQRAANLATRTTGKKETVNA